MLSAKTAPNQGTVHGVGRGRGRESYEHRLCISRLLSLSMWSDAHTAEQIMPLVMPPHYLQLVWEATHKSYWRRQALHEFLRRCGVMESFLATWTYDESKRDFLNRLFPKLEASDPGIRVINAMADALAEQKVFPDLDGWEESKRMKEDARRAVGALRLYRTKAREETADRKAQAEKRRRSMEIREQQVKQQQDLTQLSERLNTLVPQIGTSEGGYAFQSWLFDLVQYFEIQHRRPYTADGRQIDGSVTVADTTYLIEAKFTGSPTGAPDVDTFRRKVATKADNTMGLLVSMSGYTSPALNAAAGERSPLLLLAHQHLYAVLGGVLKLDELISRVRRHASQTGHAFFDLGEL